MSQDISGFGALFVLVGGAIVTGVFAIATALCIKHDMDIAEEKAKSNFDAATSKNIVNDVDVTPDELVQEAGMPVGDFA